jgi:hypothetical protein
MSTTRVLRRCVAVSFAGACLLALSSAVLPAGPVLAGTAPAAVPPGHTSAVPAGIHVTGTRVSLPSDAFLDPFTEAPNGDVYYASKSSVSVIKGTSAAVPVLTAKGTVLALAASSTGLFVTTGKTVTEYNSGATAVRTWTLAGKHRVTSAGLFAVGSHLWAWTDWSTDQSGLEYGNAYRFAASSSAVHRISSDNVIPFSGVAGSAGFYYEAPNAKVANGSYLIRVTPSGAVHRVKATYPIANLALAGGRIETLTQVVRHNTVKTHLSAYSATRLTLAFSRSVPNGDEQLAGTGLGLLLLSSSCTSKGACTEHVSQVSTKTGAAGSAGKVPGSGDLLLSGPSAALITEVGAKFYLRRLAG